MNTSHCCYRLSATRFQLNKRKCRMLLTGSVDGEKMTFHNRIRKDFHNISSINLVIEKTTNLALVVFLI